MDLGEKPDIVFNHAFLKCFVSGVNFRLSRSSQALWLHPAVQAASKGMWDESKIFGAPDFNKAAMKPQRMGSGRWIFPLYPLWHLESSRQTRDVPKFEWLILTKSKAPHLAVSKINHPAIGVPPWLWKAPNHFIPISLLGCFWWRPSAGVGPLILHMQKCCWEKAAGWFWTAIIYIYIY